MIAAPLWRPIGVTAFLLAAVLAWQVWTGIEGARKLEGLAADTDTTAKIDVVITLAFAPEAFHLTRVQEIGQLVKADGARLYVRGADRAQVKDYARAYWVVGVEPWSAGK